MVRVWVIFQNGYCHFSFGGMRCVAKWENIPNYIYYSWERMPGKRRLTDSTNCVPTYFGVKLAQNIWNVITLEALVICLYLIYSTKIRKMFSFFQKQKQYYTIANMQKNLLSSWIFILKKMPKKTFLDIVYDQGLGQLHIYNCNCTYLHIVYKVLWFLEYITY